MSSRTAFRPVFGPKTEAQTRRAKQRASRRTRKPAVDTRLANSVTGVNSYRRPRRHPTRRRVKTNASVTAITSDYIATLNNPFDYPGIRMGFGCLIPTQLSMAYAKGTLTPNTDGSFRLIGVPWDTVSGAFNATIGFSSITGVSAVPSYTQIITANASQVNAAFALGRVISGSIRASVKYPATSTPGILNCYSLSSSATTATSATIAANLSLTQAKLTGSDGAQVLYRPTDYNDFEFVSLTGGNSLMASSQMYIDGIGYPTGTIVYYEIVWHMEVYNTTGISTADLGQESGFPTLSDVHASVESAMSKVRTNLLPELVPLTGAGLFALASLQRPVRLMGGAAAAA